VIASTTTTVTLILILIPTTTVATTDMVLLLHRLTLLLVPYLSSATNQEGYAKASPLDLWSVCLLSSFGFLRYLMQHSQQLLRKASFYIILWVVSMTVWSHFFYVKCILHNNNRTGSDLLLLMLLLYSTTFPVHLLTRMTDTYNNGCYYCFRVVRYWYIRFSNGKGYAMASPINLYYMYSSDYFPDPSTAIINTATSYIGCYRSYSIRSFVVDVFDREFFTFASAPF